MITSDYLHTDGIHMRIKLSLKLLFVFSDDILWIQFGDQFVGVDSNQHIRNICLLKRKK